MQFEISLAENSFVCDFGFTGSLDNVSTEDDGRTVGDLIADMFPSKIKNYGNNCLCNLKYGSSVCKIEKLETRGLDR